MTLWEIWAWVGLAIGMGVFLWGILFLMRNDIIELVHDYDAWKAKRKEKKRRKECG